MPDSADAVTQCYVTLDGANPADRFWTDLVEVTVETSLHLPDVATLALHDPALHWIDSDDLAPGTAVTVTIKIGKTEHKLFDGEIVELEPEFGPSDHRLLVRAFDRLHRLARGRHIRSFLNVSDGDLVQRVAGEAGLSAKVAATSGVYDYVLQNNLTNLEFLQERAAALGYLLYVDGKTLHCAPPKGAGSAITLAWGAELSQFHPRLTTVDQVESVAARGWNPQTKDVVIGQVTEGHGAPEVGSQNGAALAKQAFGDAKDYLTSRPFRTQERGSQLAQGEADRRLTRSLEADGTCAGDPRLIAGVAVTVSGVGTRFGGTYVVTSASHVYSVDHYVTTFSASGHQPATLLSLLAPEGRQHRIPGLVIGLVTNAKDPEGQGRVKVKFPWLSEQDESDWARVAYPGAGSQRGIQFTPEVNDEVLVGFELGDVNCPYVLGGLWNGQDAPPTKSDQLVNPGGQVEKRLIRSRSGHIITLDDAEGGGGVTIEDKNGNKVALDSEQNTLTIEVKGNASIKAQGNLSLEAEGNLSLKSNINVSVQAQAELQAKAAMVEVNGSGMTTIKGGVINLN